MENLANHGMWITLTDLFRDTQEHFQNGGEVMIPMLIISLFIWLLIFVVAWQLLSMGKEQPVAGCMESENDCVSKGCTWQKEFLIIFHKKRRGKPSTDQKLVESILLGFRNRADKYIHTILLLAAVAPLLGLLGTVMGMITTFDTIGQFGTGNARALASGISEALITTQTGLIISVPGLLIGTILKRRTDRLLERIRRFALGTVNYLENQQSPTGIPALAN